MTKIFRQLALPMVIAILATMALPLSVDATLTVRSYENYTTGNDSSFEIWGDNYAAQTFTTNSSTAFTSHTISAVRLSLYQEGEAGNLTVSLRETNSTGYPLTSVLRSTTIDGETLTDDAGGAWVEIPIDEITLAVNTTYAIVCSGTGISAVKNVHWAIDQAGATYTGGSATNSTTGGLTYGALGGGDFMFEVFGRCTLDMVGANVYEGFVYDGDWLIVCNYLDIFEPYYTDSASAATFVLQFTKADDTLIGQVPLQQWGYMPGCIYLSNVTVASLDWGSAYKMKINTTAAPYHEHSYTLTATDWRGSDLILLDAWVISCARRMEAYYGKEYTTFAASQGYILNEVGGVHFSTGIPYLDQVRPDLFEVSISGIPYEEPTWTEAYSGGLQPWPAQVGPELAGILNDTGRLINVGGIDIGRVFFFIAYVGVAASCFVLGHGTAGTAFATPILILGVILGFVPWAFLGVALLVLVMMLARQLWWGAT